MAKKAVQEADEQQKLQTRYDRKMEKRRKQKEKEEKEEKAAKIIGRILGIAIVAALVIIVGTSVFSRVSAVKGTYIQVGDAIISKLEYDYYYNSTVNSYITSYGSILPYMGLDTSADFDTQAYSDNLSWKDAFDQMATQQIMQNKALIADAEKNSYVYENEDSEYDSFLEGVKTAASEAGQSLSKYYKQAFGEYATPANTKDFVKESIVASAYYNKLLEDKAPTEDEIKAYYEENKIDYDKVDYKHYTFTADVSEDASEEEISKAMDEIKAKAEEMAKAREEGEDFEALCEEYNGTEAASEDDANAETAYPYNEEQGKYRTSMSTLLSDWLFDDARQEGDVTVLTDEDAHKCYVVEFDSRYFDEADNDSISSTIASQRVSDYVDEIAKEYENVDGKGHLKYLTVEESEESSDAATEETADPAAETQDEETEQ